MKLIYVAAAIVLTALFGLPFGEYDTARLLPIQTVQVAPLPAGGVRIVSEVGCGEGETWKAAVEDLRRTASGEVFFDTAEQVVFITTESAGLSPAAEPIKDDALLRQVLDSDELRPSAQVYTAPEVYPPEGLNAYLSAHESGQTVADLRAAEVAPAPGEKNYD